MSLRSLVQSSAVALVLVTSSWARAQCTMDTECKGDRLCEGGKCVAPPPAPAPAAQPAAVAKPAAARPVVVVPVVSPAVAPSESSKRSERSETRLMRRHSTGMMVGGIVMTSLAPVAFFVAGIYGLGSALCSPSNYSCDEYATVAKVSLLSGLVLVGAGVPLIVVGGKKEPVEEDSATISPWATPTAAGLSLRLAL